MTTVFDYGGWIEIKDKSAAPQIYKILCEGQPMLKPEDPSATWIDYPSDGHTGWSLDTRIRKVTIKNIWFKTTAHCKDFVGFLEAHQTDGFEIKIKINSDNSYWDWDGDTHTIMPVMWEKCRGIRKLFGGNSTIWEIAQVIFRQKAALVA